MLEAVGHPHAVNPDRGLRAAAAARDWPVLGFALGPSSTGLSRSAGGRMRTGQSIEITNWSRRGVSKQANSS
jgi:hypothetical protein